MDLAAGRRLISSQARRNYWPTLIDAFIAWPSEMVILETHPGKIPLRTGGYKGGKGTCGFASGLSTRSVFRVPSTSGQADLQRDM
jgi:hypothetical protein